MMSLGSLMVGVAVLAVVVAYVARPFRTSGGRGMDQRIEAWVARVQAGLRTPSDEAPVMVSPAAPSAPSRIVNFCPQCGQRAKEGDRFCSACGVRLPREGS